MFEFVCFCSNHQHMCLHISCKQCLKIKIVKDCMMYSLLICLRIINNFQNKGSIHFLTYKIPKDSLWYMSVKLCHKCSNQIWSYCSNRYIWHYWQDRIFGIRCCNKCDAKYLTRFVQLSKRLHSFKDRFKWRRYNHQRQEESVMSMRNQSMFGFICYTSHYGKLTNSPHWVGQLKLRINQ